MLKYSNGWGHLIMSVVSMVVGILLVWHGNPGVGLGLISVVGSAWFVPGAAKQVAQQVTQQVQKVAGATMPSIPAVAPAPKPTTPPLTSAPGEFTGL